MNKEFKENIDAMDNDEKYNYSNSLHLMGRVVDVLGVGLILLMLIFPNIFIIIAGVAAVYFLGLVSLVVKEAYVYIDNFLSSN